MILDGHGPPASEDLADLFENAPCGYISLLPDGRIHRVNQTLSEWLGFPAQTMTGKRLRDFLNVAGRIFYETHFAPLLRMQGAFDEVALDLVAVDGTTLNVLASARERRDPDGKLLFTRVALHRAGERRRYERELVKARNASEAAGALTQSILDLERENSQLREQFIAVLGHDLRNPLGAISAAQVLIGREPQTERATALLQLQAASISRMVELIDNVLDFARARLSDGLSIDRNADEPLEPLLRHVVAELQSTHPSQHIDVTFSMPDPVYCDRGRIAQLASNLLGNALSHGDAEASVQVSARTRDGIFELSVGNAGKPISAKTMERLFQPFFRGEVRASQHGLGLGLHIASEVAKAHGGAISVESTKQETRFTFTMPLTSIS